MRKTNILSSFVALTLLAASLSSCALFTGQETTTEYADDVAITASVKKEIYAEPQLKMFEISVETMKGVVQLSGFVENHQQVLKAAELARRVEGVRKVENSIKVRR